MNADSPSLDEGFLLGSAQPNDLDAVVELFDEAFASKFTTAVRDPVLRKKLWAHVIDLTQVTVAKRGCVLLGMMLVSFEGSPGFRKPKTRSIVKLLGLKNSLRAALVFLLFSVLDNKPLPGQAYIEAICVSSNARGLGVGSALLAEAKRVSRDKGLGTLDLSVVLENADAKRLYLREGFAVLKTKRSSTLHFFTSVSGADVMRHQVSSAV